MLFFLWSVLGAFCGARAFFFIYEAFDVTLYPLQNTPIGMVSTCDHWASTSGATKARNFVLSFPFRIYSFGGCGFRLKRAGLDYWHAVCVKTHDSWEVRCEFII